jgi:biopolymer transport protein ExbB/TolQ
MLTEKLMRLTIAGGSEWVMIVLIALSVISISVIIERAVFFARQRKRLDQLDRELTPAINGGDAQQMRQVVERTKNPALEAALAKQGDREAREQIVASVLGRERLYLEQRLTFLGTLGNNAPFIGLFGTVLGIIKAFNVLSSKTSEMGGSPEVMSGISEALVATAIGLFVAIPAVIAFNYFQKQVERTISITESLAQAVLAGAGREGGGN